jgi:hypothetical protein
MTKMSTFFKDAISFEDAQIQNTLFVLARTDRRKDSTHYLSVVMKVNSVPRSRRYLLYKIIGIIMSIIAAIAWLVTIVTLLGLWSSDGFIRYDTDDGNVVYISNVGAVHKSEFITGAVITGIAYFLTLLFTKLYFDLKVDKRFRRIISIILVLCSFIGSVGLILLSILDSVKHKSAHYTFVGIFIVFTLASGILGIIYRLKKTEFNWALGIRVLLIGLFIPLAITFIVMGFVGGRYANESTLKSVAACLEWSIAILIIFYFATFALDFFIYE